MELLLAILIIICMMVGVVVYQSRKDKPPFRTYLTRFSKLAVILLSIFKDVGVCLSQKYRSINWDLTKTKPGPDPNLDSNLGRPRNVKPTAKAGSNSFTDDDLVQPSQQGGKIGYASWR